MIVKSCDSSRSTLVIHTAKSLAVLEAMLGSGEHL
jgi:hypothetical protein